MGAKVLQCPHLFLGLIEKKEERFTKGHRTKQANCLEMFVHRNLILLEQ